MIKKLNEWLFTALKVFAAFCLVAMIVMVIVSWVAPNSHNPAAELAWQISEPVLAPFRRIVPNLGGMDISPIFAFLAIQVIQSFVMPPLAAYAGMPQELWRMI